MRRVWIAVGIAAGVFAVIAMGATNVLQIFQGGTGLGTIGTPGQVLTVNDAGTALYYSTIIGTDGGAIGTVTAVTGTPPIASSGGPTPAISLNVSGVDAGTYLLATVTVDVHGLVTNISAGQVDAGTVTNIATTAPIAGGPITTTGTLTCNVASGSQPGCLSSTDWTTFNSKQAALTLPLTVPNGGTGLATLTAHSLQVGNGTSTPTQLGLGTSTTVLHGAAAGDPTWGAVLLTGDVTGTLGVGNGGTGIASANASAVVIGGGSTSAFVPVNLLLGQTILGQGTSVVAPIASFNLARAFRHVYSYYPLLGSGATLAVQVGSAPAITAQGLSAGTASADDYYVKWTCTTTSAVNCGVASSTFMQTRWNPQTSSRVRTDTTWNTQFRAWIALLSDTAESTLLDGGAHNYAGVRYSTTASDTNWQCCTGDGSANSCTDTGVAVTISSSTAYNIVVEVNGSTTYCTVNGTQVSKTTNQPTTTTALELINEGACANGASSCSGTNDFQAAGLEVAWQ